MEFWAQKNVSAFPPMSDILITSNEPSLKHEVFNHYKWNEPKKQF